MSEILDLSLKSSKDKVELNQRLEISDVELGERMETSRENIIAVKSGEYECCFCSTVHIKKVTFTVAVISAALIVSNFLAKLGGYSEIGWNFELLFLVVDTIAVASLIYGVQSERAAFLQPFVLLSIVTTSFLILLAAYFGSAAVNPNSYAGQDLELELHKRLSEAARKFSLEFKSMVSLVATVAFFGILISIFVHFWAVYLTVQCARHFREVEALKFSNGILKQG